MDNPISAAYEGMMIAVKEIEAAKKEETLIERQSSCDGCENVKIIGIDACCGCAG